MNILLVCADSANPSVSETALETLFAGDGHTVTRISDETAEPSLASYDLVWISDSVSGAILGAKYASASIGVVVGSIFLATNSNLYSGGSNESIQNNIYVSDGTHPTAGGLANGSHVVYTSAATTDSANASSSYGAGVFVVLRQLGVSSTTWMGFGYDSGGTLYGGGTAPARRFCLCLSSANLFNATANAIALAVADWTAGAVADTTPPTLSNASATATGSTTAAGSVDTDEGNGTLYWVVTASDTAPTEAQVQAGQDHTGAAALDSGSQAVSTAGTQNVTGGFTGLPAATLAYAHYQQQDAATIDSTVVTSAGFTTDANVVQSEAVAFVEDESFAGTPAATHIAGTVTQGGAPVEGLAVIALNRTTDTASIAQTDAAGAYVIAGLTPGDSYMVIPEVHEDTGVFYRANPAIRAPTVNGD